MGVTPLSGYVRFSYIIVLIAQTKDVLGWKPSMKLSTTAMLSLSTFGQLGAGLAD